MVGEEEGADPEQDYAHGVVGRVPWSLLPRYPQRSYPNGLPKPLLALLCVAENEQKKVAEGKAMVRGRKRSRLSAHACVRVYTQHVSRVRSPT